MVLRPNRVSASRATMMSPRAAARPRLSAMALPPFSNRSRRTIGWSLKCFSTSAEVLSLEPSSMTRISMFVQADCSTCRMDEAITASSL